MKSFRASLADWTDRFAACALRKQIRAADSRDFGGFLVASKGFSEPNLVARCIDVLLAAYYNPDSRYYRQPRLLESAGLYASNLLREQHEDGTLDLKETNFHDATAAAFSVQVLGYTYRLLAVRSEGGAAEVELADRLLLFLRRAAPGLARGGFHTPNHRWVMASALALLLNILGDESLRAEIVLYLNEGIDCDEDGEYTERSVGHYNAINNRSLIILSEELRMPELLEHVRRNLNLVLFYVEPDGTLFTLNSTRQDYGKDIYPVAYYDNYAWMAWKTRNPAFAAMARSQVRRAFRLAQRADSDDELIGLLPFPHYMTWLLLRPELAEDAAATAAGQAKDAAGTAVGRAAERNAGEHPQPADESAEPESSGWPCLSSDTGEPEGSSEPYENWFANSGVVRIASGGPSSLTLVEKSSIFLKFQHGSSKVYVKFASSFFARGQFKAERIRKTDRGYRLSYSCDWGYVRPLPHGFATSVWDEMDHASRSAVQLQHFEVYVDVIPEPDGVALEIEAGGTAGVPCKLELLLDPGGTLKTGDSILRGDAGRSMILRQGDAAYTRRGDRIVLQGGFGEHGYAADMRGSEPQAADRFTVCLTGFTPVRRRVRIVADPDRVVD